jgi:hypothetical protein
LAAKSCAVFWAESSAVDGRNSLPIHHGDGQHIQFVTCGENHSMRKKIAGCFWDTTGDSLANFCFGV